MSQSIANAASDDLTGGAVRRGRNRWRGMAITVVIGFLFLLVGLGAGIALQKYALLGNGQGSGTGGTSPSQTTITETGSSLIYPLMQLWGPAYTSYNPSVTISPASTGSGAGISAAEAGTVDIGGTDAFINATIASHYQLLDVATAISAQLIFYNLPGITAHLNLNGTVLAMIYKGSITNWDDPLIQAANPGVSLPNHAIATIHRSDGSGDTFMFSSLCQISWKGWTYGYGTTIGWLSNSIGAQGNGGMITTLHSTSYGIAYIGISYLNQATADGLQYAALGDQAANVNGTNPENYVMPTSQNISEDANLGLQYLQPPSLAVSLILGGDRHAVDSGLRAGEGGTLPTAEYPTPYPDVNLENLLIAMHSAHEKQVVQFLEWALSYGNNATQFLDTVHFLPLTPTVVGYDMNALQSVSFT